MARFGVGEPWEISDPANEPATTESSMMSNTRKIPKVEWLVYKEEIRSLYLIENKSREEVMTAMEKSYGFHASKAQYTRKFDEWGFKKNSTDAKWKFIARKLQKRNLEGKESDTYIDGKLVPRKKVKKEVSRHPLPSWQIISIAGRSPSPLGGIEIHTPPREHTPFVKYLHIPWFEFETLVEPQSINSSLDGFYEQSILRSHNPSALVPTSQVAIITNQNQHEITAPWDPIFDDPRNDQRIQNSFPHIQVREKGASSISALSHDHQARSLFAKILGKSINPNSQDYLSTVTSHLDNILIERQDGEITKNLQKFFGSSTFDITLQLLRYSVYLSSNNLLSENQTDMLLKWVVESGQFAAIAHLIKLKTATTEVFASNILLSAVRINYNSTVRDLIALGVDVNIPGGCYPKKLALLEVVKYLTTKRFWDRRQEVEVFHLVEFLLEAGADINAKSGPYNTSPLQEVVFLKHVKLVRTFLSYRTLDSLADDPNFPYPILRKAVRDNDSNQVEILLNMKANLDALAQLSMITPLQDAASWHDSDAVQVLLDIGADVDAPLGIIYEVARKAAVESNELQNLQSAIQIAACRGKVEMVQILLEAGADVDGYPLTQEEYSAYESIADRTIKEDYNYLEGSFYPDEYDNYPSMDFEYSDGEYCDEYCTYHPHFYWTPLQSAVERKDFVLVRLLLVAGANIEGRGLGLTPLQLAAFKNETRLVRLLLKHGAAINAPARGYKGRTALQAAAKNGNTDLIEVLLNAGSDLNATAGPNSGFTALQIAVQTNNIKLVEKLIFLGADVNAAASPIRGLTCLQAAAHMGNSGLVQILLDSGAEVNAAGSIKYGFTALQAAARQGDLFITKMLVAAGADIHTPSTEGGCSTISAAIMGMNLEIVQLFLRTASPNDLVDSVPLLFRASAYGKPEIVQCLIKAGANINALYTNKLLNYNYPRTALEAALNYSRIEVFEMLWDAGAGCNGQVPGLRAALGAASARWRHYTVEPIHIDIARKLINAGADVNRAFSSEGAPLHNAVYAGRLDLVQMLLDAGADVNGKAPDGNTALLNAVHKDDIDIIKVLLDAGADIKAFAPVERGRTALQGAAECGNTAAVRFLLERGADCNEPAAQSEGVTALQAAAIGGHLQVALTLLKAGANINAPAAKINGRSALEAAAEHGRLDIVSLLLENDIDANGLGSRCKDAAKLAERNGHIFISRMLRNYKKA
ncbi:ankyrin repeat-containing domain protein [Tricladium varicosporioides]|nr:ankyrin repeat-containing domain protein [Hymenoscyphus varicosporioides]